MLQQGFTEDFTTNHANQTPIIKIIYSCNIVSIFQFFVLSTVYMTIISVKVRNVVICQIFSLTMNSFVSQRYHGKKLLLRQLLSINLIFFFLSLDQKSIISPSIVEHTGHVSVAQDEGAVLLCVAQGCDSPEYRYLCNLNFVF